jgi:hypothetical protein|tara:strand:- start:750 stop:974 length:225 start_codon:yes stop_codon:yes gene_type:complete
MIGKIILTIMILGGGAFLLLSDGFEEYIGPYASATASDIENLKNDPVVQDKVNHIIEVIYEKLVSIKLSLGDFF